MDEENETIERIGRGAKAPRVIVEITQDVIDSAKQRESSHCMIAEAIKRAVPKASRISVDLATIRWTDREKGLRYIYLTPRVGQLSLIQFDQGDAALQPFQLRLRRPTVIRANTKKKADDIPKRATMVTTERDKQQGNVPTRIGGSAPPLAPLSNSSKVKVGQRREYGLRALSK